MITKMAMLSLLCVMTNLSGMIPEVKDAPSVQSLLESNEFSPLAIELGCNIHNYRANREMVNKNVQGNVSRHILLQSHWFSEYDFVSNVEKALKEKKSVTEFESIVKQNPKYSEKSQIIQKLILASVKQAFVDCSNFTKSDEKKN